MKTTVLVALIITVAGRFMADEVKAWFGWLHAMLRRKAVEKLPEECRERYNEEWESGLEEIPGEVFKLIYSLGLLRASLGISNAHLLKRLLDILFSILVLIALSPWFLAIAIAIKIETPGPVLYSSERIGKRGRVFKCTKFRTTVPIPWAVADNSVSDFEHNGDRYSLRFELLRITKVGRFLRKYSQDHLPSFLNIFQGDMSVFGHDD